MILRFALLTTLAFSVAGFSSAAEKMSLDSEKSKINFVGSKPDGKHPGGFKEFTADAVVDLEDPSNGSLEIVITAASLFSDSDKLTNHLKSPDFFDVRKHPKITFKATKITHADGEEKASITGIMTMLGKEVEVTIPVAAKVTETEITLTANFKIDRTKWGMVYGKGKIDDEVPVTAVLVLNR
ncbi:YceI family protein [Allorhodopirellula heiligendammensis]|uniref:Lipid/polyisoprenoid-binding YceI-like domain-containing protein n=1 Tax=Allorhodopirellula heiligendammensis TaxID=2714739 RepID=A0A5C6BEB1_9BACT|nr:YceI family protein [Allorhodopirellula heiligendammensis]TWU09987.1 hypothetical protein Poly21_53200 [Allorhodopirellula heiligendammensis]